jgi:hypothetical protein
LSLFSVRRVLAVLLAAALLVPACTGDDGSDDGGQSTNTVGAGRFMEDVCTAMSDWLAGFLAGYQQVRSLDPNASAQQGKESLDTFLTEAIVSTEELQQAITEAGRPDVAGGDDFSSNLIDALDRALVAFRDARDRLKGLPNDPTKFRTAVAALGDTVREQLAAAGDAIGQNVPALQEAAADTPACQSLGGAVGGPPGA